MMFVVVPALMCAIVTTAGSNASTVRVTITCRAVTISAATTIGSSARCGSDAWPPRPRTVARMKSAAAICAPARWLTVPLANLARMWMPNAAFASSPAGRSRSPSSSIARAP